MLLIITSSVAGITANTVTASAVEYNEPMVRIGLVYKSDVQPTYKVSAANGYEIGYITKSDNSFTKVYSESYKDLTVSIDGSSYVQISAYVDNNYNYYTNLALLDAEPGLKELVKNYNVTLIPSLNNGKLVYRIEFGSQSEAQVFLNGMFNDIDTQNVLNGTDYSVAASVSVPNNTSVKLINSSGVNVFSFDTDDKGIALAVNPIQTSGVTYIYTSNGNRYDGMFEFRRFVLGSYDGISVINVLPLEKYVACVVSCEVYSSWPTELHKVMAVTIRSYTMTHFNCHSAYNFDLCSTTDCQAYLGNRNVNSSIRTAVEDTRGIVAVYNGNIPSLFYSAIAGGVSVNVRDVWGSNIDYLVAVPTPWESYASYTMTTRGSWRKEYTGTELYELLKGYYSNLQGDIASVKINRLCENSTYVDSMTFTDIYGNNATMINCNTMRVRLKLNSGNFVVAKAGEDVSRLVYSLDNFPSVYSPDYNGIPYQAFSDVTLEGITSNGVVPIDSNNVGIVTSSGSSTLSMIGKTIELIFSDTKGYLNDTGLPDILNANTVVSAETIKAEGTAGSFEFIGRGWGHGIGLSQYGACDLVKLGYDYKTVIQYYYQGVSFSTIPEVRGY